MIRCRALGIALITTQGGPMPCTPPPPCFPCVVLSCDRRTHSGLSSGFLEGRERECSWPSPPCCTSGFPFGVEELGRWAERVSHVTTHTRCQKLGRPPTSELSMLLMSAQCSVRSRTFLQGPTPAPRSLRGCPSRVHRMLSFCIVLIF